MAHPRGGNAEHIQKITLILGLLNVAEKIADIDVGTLRLHQLKGDLKRIWSVTVRANWRIVFKFDGDNIFDVDLTDYH